MLSVPALEADAGAVLALAVLAAARVTGAELAVGPVPAGITHTVPRLTRAVRAAVQVTPRWNKTTRSDQYWFIYHTVRDETARAATFNQRNVRVCFHHADYPS